MIPSHDIVDVVDSSWSISDFGEICWPNSSIGILGLVLRYIWSIDMIRYYSVSVVPFLVIILLVVMMSWIDGKH